MKHVAIIGAGIGGMPAAYEMKEALGNAGKVTVINASPNFQFVPSNPWLAVGWREKKDITIPIAPALAKKGIEFIAQAVTEIQADKNTVVLMDGQIVNYDYLIITTGPKLAFDEIEGTGPEGHTQSICTTDHAQQAFTQYEQFVKDPGPIVVGAAQMASCFGPAYEFAFILDTDLRKRKIRDKVPMTYITSEPYIGHLGLGGVGDSKGMLESEFRSRHIKWITNAKINKVDEKVVYVSEHNAEGEVIKEHEVEHRFSMILPAFKGVDAVANVEGLCNPRGFVFVDEFQRNPTFNNIYSAGVCIAIPPVEATPVPTGAPKTGYMIESMVTAAVTNIKADIDGKTLNARATWNAICLADMGDTGAAFVALPQIPPRNLNWFKKGKWVHYAKIAFEKFFIRKMKNGTSQPVYEKVILKYFGIEKLKQDN